LITQFAAIGVDSDFIAGDMMAWPDAKLDWRSTRHVDVVSRHAAVSMANSQRSRLR